MCINDFYKKCSNKKIAFLGAGISNLPLIYKMLSYNIDVSVFDQKDPEENQALINDLLAAGAKVKFGKECMENIEADIVFRSPGIDFFSNTIKELVDKGCIVTSEMEIFMECCPATTIAITGSDGKTTTSTLIFEMLLRDGKNVYLGGNIGNSLILELESMKTSDFVVLELSSFQLISMRNNFDVSVITNITPNHLDVHRNFKEYIDAKKNIFLHQNAFTKTIINRDNIIVFDLSKEVRGNALYFSTKSVCNGAWIDINGDICLKHGENVQRVASTKDMKLVGNHNKENILAAVLAVYEYVDLESIRSVICTFSGIKYRIEYFATISGVDYYDDSSATTPSRTVACLNSFDEKVILIAGGSDKKIPFDELGSVILSKCKLLILTGNTSSSIKKSVIDANKNTCLPILECNNLTEAISLAKRNAKSGDKVVLSPACASFDSFKNYKQRGDEFKKLVLE